MAWFSVGLPLLLQVVLPISLLAALAFGKRACRATIAAGALLVGAYLTDIYLAGLWLVLPWYTPVAYGAALLVVIITIRQRFIAAPLWPTSRAAQVSTIATS